MHLPIPDVVKNGPNVEENTGQVLLVVNKEHVNIYTNGILNVKVVPVVVIIQDLPVVSANGNNVVENYGKVLVVA